jgi:membrane protein YqaA with SNARE-associated domain
MMIRWFKNAQPDYNSWANKKWASWALLILAFADASILPMPTSTYFMVLTSQNNQKATKFLLLAVVGTLAGGLAGYCLGSFLMHAKGYDQAVTLKYLFSHLPGFSESMFDKINLLYSKWNKWVLIIAAATPIPYGFFSISAGTFETGMLRFLIATVIGQGIRFMFLTLITTKISQGIRKLFFNRFRPAEVLQRPISKLQS